MGGVPGWRGKQETSVGLRVSDESFIFVSGQNKNNFATLVCVFQSSDFESAFGREEF